MAFKEKTLVIIYKQETEGSWSTEFVGDTSLKEKFLKQTVEKVLRELLH